MTSIAVTTQRIEYVDPCPGMKGTDTVTEECAKCGGTGSIEAFAHVYAGECFDCNGHGNHERKVRSVRAAARHQVRLHNNIVDKEEAAVALLADDRELADALDAMPLDNDFTRSIRAQLLTKGTITANQRAAVIRAAKREAAKQETYANAANIPEGRFQIGGEVLTVKAKENRYGVTLKMLVQSPEGWKIWGTVPGALDVHRGDKVQFIATVEASEDDAKFGFFKRPTKARVVNR